MRRRGLCCSRDGCRRLKDTSTLLLLLPLLSGGHRVCKAETGLGLPRAEVSKNHETSSILKNTHILQEKRRIAETGGEVLLVCEGRDVNALEVNVHQNPGGLHRLHADLPGEWLG